MTYKKHFGKNLVLAVPVMLSQAGQVLVNVADNVMVGELGEVALGAVSLGNAVFVAALVFAFGFSMAMSPLVAEAEAKSNTQRVRNLLTHGLVLNLTLGVVLSLFIYGLLPLMHYADQPVDVVALAVPYLKINLISLVPIMIFQSFRQFSEGISLTIPVTIATLFANVVNIVLNYLLIYGKMGFPMLGVEGAAWGSTIARVLMVFLLIIILYNWNSSRTYLLGIRFREWKRSIFKKLIVLGAPTGFQLLFEVTAFSAAAFICGLAGTTDLAAHQIAINLASITFLLCTGLSVAGTIRIGNQLGLKDYKNLRKVGVSIIYLATIFMAFCGLVFIAGRTFFPNLYINNPDVIGIAASLLVVAALFQLSDGIQVVTLGALRGIQDVLIPTLITLVAYWAITIPLGYYLTITLKMGAIGMWSALGVGLTLSAIMLVWRFHSKTKNLIQQASLK